MVSWQTQAGKLIDIGSCATSLPNIIGLFPFASARASSTRQEKFPEHLSLRFDNQRADSYSFEYVRVSQFPDVIATIGIRIR